MKPKYQLTLFSIPQVTLINPSNNNNNKNIKEERKSWHEQRSLVKALMVWGLHVSKECDGQRKSMFPALLTL